MNVDFGILGCGNRSPQPTHPCGEQRPQEKQAEVKQCGPYSSIVLAVVEVEREGEAAGAPDSRVRVRGRREARNQSGNAAAIGVKGGKCGAQKALFRGDDRNVDSAKPTASTSATGQLSRATAKPAAMSIEPR